MPQLARWLTFVEEFDREGRITATLMALAAASRKSRMSTLSRKRTAIPTPKAVTRPETEEAVMNVRPVKVDLAENMETDEESSVMGGSRPKAALRPRTRSASQAAPLVRTATDNRSVINQSRRNKAPVESVGTIGSP